MSELPDVIGGDTITSAFTNDVKDRTVMRYADATARDASVPVPAVGDVAWLASENQLTIYNGASWEHIVGASGGDFTGQIRLLPGTQGLPGAAFAGDTDTGIFGISPNQFYITTGGVWRIRVQSTNVTITPDVHLDGSLGVNTTPTGVQVAIESELADASLSVKRLTATTSDVVISQDSLLGDGLFQVLADGSIISPTITAMLARLDTLEL